MLNFVLSINKFIADYIYTIYHAIIIEKFKTRFISVRDKVIINFCGISWAVIGLQRYQIF